MVDVITVPDFSSEAASRFELRTLLFLGSWMEHRGGSRSWPLHLACIGEPPASVRRLAARAGAVVTVHEPFDRSYPAPCNKLRAFDLPPTSDRFLLLDTDVLVLRDLEPLASAVGDGIGVGPATGNPISEILWHRVFEAIGVPYPRAAGTCWHAMWDLSAHRRITTAYREQCLSMPPYFNSGVVLAPWRCGLGPVWMDHTRRLMAAVEDLALSSEDQGVVRFLDQVSLATATAALALSGVQVVTPPLAYQARPPLLVSGVLPWNEVALFHYIKTLSHHGETVKGVGELLYGRRLHAARRRLAGWFGLWVVRSPVFRLVDPRRVQTYGGFFDHIHRIFRDHIARTR